MLKRNPKNRGRNGYRPPSLRNFADEEINKVPYKPEEQQLNSRGAVRTINKHINNHSGFYSFPAATFTGGYAIKMGGKGLIYLFDLAEDVKELVKNSKVGLTHIRDWAVGPEVEERIDNLEAKVEGFSPGMVSKLESIRDSYEKQMSLQSNLNQYESILYPAGKIGNKLKPSWLKRIDRSIEDIFSGGFNIKIPSDADIETYYGILGKLKEDVDDGNYTNAKALEKLAELETHIIQRKKETVKEYLDSLEELTELGIKIDNQMDLKKVTDDEDYLNSMNKTLEQYQSAYKTHLNKTEALVGPIEPRINDGLGVFVDGVITYGPFVLAAAGYSILYFVAGRIPFLGKKLRKSVITKAFCLPVTVPLYATAHTIDFTVNHIKPKVKKVIERIKNKGGNKK